MSGPATSGATGLGRDPRGACDPHAERAGFVREGVRRKTYWRNEQWVDGMLFGLIREDLEGE